MAFRVASDSSSLPSGKGRVAPEPGRIQGAPSQTRHGRARSALFTVDIGQTRGKIAANRIPPQLQTRTPQVAGADKGFCLGETKKKADLGDRIGGACHMSKTQATTAIDTAVDSITA